jgi:hypothetical protein
MPPATKQIKTKFLTIIRHQMLDWDHVNSIHFGIVDFKITNV